MSFELRCPLNNKKALPGNVTHDFPLRRTNRSWQFSRNYRCFSGMICVHNSLLRIQKVKVQVSHRQRRTDNKKPTEKNAKISPGPTTTWSHINMTHWMKEGRFSFGTSGKTETGLGDKVSVYSYKARITMTTFGSQKNPWLSRKQESHFPFLFNSDVNLLFLLAGTVIVTIKIKALKNLTGLRR